VNEIYLNQPLGDDYGCDDCDSVVRIYNHFYRTVPPDARKEAVRKKMEEWREKHDCSDGLICLPMLRQAQ
jgi:hypothetical protein